METILSGNYIWELKNQENGLNTGTRLGDLQIYIYSTMILLLDLHVLLLFWYGI